MGHLVGKDLFRKLGEKIDGLETRTPWNETLYAILKELYTDEEADLVVRMPNGLSTLERLQQTTAIPKERLTTLLHGLAEKGLVLDIWGTDAWHYAPSPFIIGIMEFSMMRTGPEVNTKVLAGLFHDYLRGSFLESNYGHGEVHSIFRTVPHEEAIRAPERTEILDYEKAAALIAHSKRFAIGICACRHEMMHLGSKGCDVPLESCTSFDVAADLLIRHKLAREVSRREMEEWFTESRSRGLVLTADNVRTNVRFVCHCCGCCCNLLRGISEYGYGNIIVTSNYIAAVDHPRCAGCGKCAKACPIRAIAMTCDERDAGGKRTAAVDDSICLGCGVCALSCRSGALTLAQRSQRVIHPENTFERIMLQSLEKGTLQNQIFDDPSRMDHRLLRAFVGGFLRLPPVKKALLGDRFRSRFLGAMKGGIEREGKGWMLQL
ncbi:4Fe-4S dicluster domain-containing protein [Geomonas sp. RF6]|uniref:ATP-binding protein n=1 Tax=Geomonas sp. RF6 TaxID=2897342 RepID=UPI001E4C7BCF|nr:4Fe-4S dicluster domain-containing protein [Geomonas sp. RF6]UFS70182.1 4Fe-4S dicluster domain-containing protein [Geomonas sp. RF6]